MDSNYTNYSANANISPEAARAAFLVFGGIMIFILVLVLITYIYMAICLMKMAHKTRTDNAWLAWIPIANCILMLQIAKKPLWWIILFLVPFVNIVISVLVWMAICKELKKPEWLGILMIVPIANIIIPGYLAFSKEEISSVPPANPTPPIPPVQPTPTV